MGRGSWSVKRGAWEAWPACLCARPLLTAILSPSKRWPRERNGRVFTPGEAGFPSLFLHCQKGAALSRFLRPVFSTARKTRLCPFESGSPDAEVSRRSAISGAPGWRRPGEVWAGVCASGGVQKAGGGLQETGAGFSISGGIIMLVRGMGHGHDAQWRSQRHTH